MPDPLITAVLDATATRAKNVLETLDSSLTNDRVFKRIRFQYAWEKDGCPALIVFPSDGQQITRKKTLDGKYLDNVIPVTIVFATPGNMVPTTADPIPNGNPPEQRTQIREILERTFYGKAKSSEGWPAEVFYLSPNPEAYIDLSAYESAGLWITAVSFFAKCRTTLP